VHTERVTGLEKADSPSMAVQAVGATFAALLAAPTGPLAPFVAAAATPLTTQMAQRITRESSRKSHVVEESALESSGLDPDDLASCRLLREGAKTPGLKAPVASPCWLAGSVTGGRLG